MQGFYQTHRNSQSCLYTDNIIYSPQVPVFRDDNGNLLDRFYLLSIITSPAVNVGAAIKSKQEISHETIINVMSERAKNVLTVAVVNNHKNIILGAWGCGVFQNSPQDIAEIFYKHLIADNQFQGFFDRIVFAVLDTSKKQDTIQAFQTVFPRTKSEENK